MSCSVAAFVLVLLAGVSRQESSHATTVQMITGRVLGAVAGVERAIQYWHEPGKQWRRVLCDPDGAFTIEGLSEATPVRLRAVQKRPLEAGNFDLTGTGSPEWQRASPELSVAPGTRGIELRIPPPSRYRLRVVEAGTGLPLADVRIGLLTVFDFETGGVPDDFRAEGDGVYSLALHRPDSGDGLALAVACEGHERVAVGELPFVPGVTQHLGAVELKRLVPTEIFVVRDGDGRPVDGASVTARIEFNDDGCLNAHLVGAWPARSALPDGWSGTTSAEGIATAFLSSGRSYWIGVEHPGHAQLWHRVETEPRPPRRIDLVLLLPASLAVRCVDEQTGEPISGEALGYERVDTYEWEYVSTGPDGTVCIDGLSPGTYRVWPRSQGRGFDEVAEVASGGTVDVTLSIRKLDRDR